MKRKPKGHARIQDFPLFEFSSFSARLSSSLSQNFFPVKIFLYHHPRQESSRASRERGQKPTEKRKKETEGEREKTTKKDEEKKRIDSSAARPIDSRSLFSPPPPPPPFFFGSRLEKSGGIDKMKSLLKDKEKDGSGEDPHERRDPPCLHAPPSSCFFSLFLHLFQNCRVSFSSSGSPSEFSSLCNIEKTLKSRNGRGTRTGPKRDERTRRRRKRRKDEGLGQTNQSRETT